MAEERGIAKYRGKPSQFLVSFKVDIGIQIGNLDQRPLHSCTKQGRPLKVGCLISDFNFTSKTLLVKVILLVKLDQHSKKDLV